MSWVQSAVSQANGDVFDEDADEMGIAQKEWKSTMEKRVRVSIAIILLSHSVSCQPILSERSG